MKIRIIAAMAVVIAAMTCLVIGGFWLVGRSADDRVLTGAALSTAYVVLGAICAVCVAVVLFWLFVAPKHVVGSLKSLNALANALADNTLPQVVGLLSEGRPVDTRAMLGQVVPADGFGPDEFGDLGRAFERVGEAAVSSAVAAAASRSQRRFMELLARRVQGHVQQQLRDLESLERLVGDDEQVLARLYAVDQTAMQLRRYTENMLIAVGKRAGRQWTKPQLMVDVIRAATGEVNNYERVDVIMVDRSITVQGPCVADIGRLLAEVIDNAVHFSPPHTKVDVIGEAVGNGFAVEVLDRGLGMEENQLDELNHALRNPPELPDLVNNGLFTIALLANRRGVEVTLRNSPYGGTTAIVFIPASVLGPPVDARDQQLSGATIPIIPTA